ncbi:MAG: helix-turn-helix domain-containing protein [Candidatus Thiodiazotropha sp. (ex Ctena orbiculata)]|nr:helix-turn-helix domain-containing protein [Candidatus Thiodiazotropha taylori]MBT3034561.1 helix-turn-helix domain-containing protein [Candidatus Thiodiazotropha taylori]
MNNVNPEKTLKILRTIAGVSQHEVAALLGRSQPYISLIENGFVQLKTSERKILAKRFGKALIMVDSDESAS